MNHLPHATDDCTGEWMQLGRRGSGTWRCPACDVEHPSTPENDAAADREFARGMQLRSQERQGRFPHLRPQLPPVIELPDPYEED